MSSLFVRIKNTSIKIHTYDIVVKYIRLRTGFAASYAKCSFFYVLNRPMNNPHESVSVFLPLRKQKGNRENGRHKLRGGS